MSRAGHDYLSLIAGAVDALPINVRETRLTLYGRARRAQLSSFDPAIPEAEFRRERAAAPEGSDYRGDREGDRSVPTGGAGRVITNRWNISVEFFGGDRP